MSPVYEKFLSSRVNYIETSPIREAVSKIAARSRVAKVISFAAGEPDPDVIPRELYGELAREVFAREKKSVAYSPADGLPDLKAEIAGFMKEYEGVATTPENIVVTLGGSQAIDIVGRLMLDPGDIVFVENPSYVNTILVWRHYGVRTIGIPVDDEGMVTERLEEAVKAMRGEGRKLKLVYTIPTGQNPSGVTMSMERRKHLLEIASRHDLLIVEDAAYNHLVYEPAGIKPLRAMDGEGRVLYIGSFSKIFGTGLRIGWLEAPGEIVEKARAAKGPMDMCAPVPSQYIVLNILRNKLYRTIREKAVSEYRVKRDLMISAIEKHLPGLRHTRPVAGMFILLWLPGMLDGRVFADQLLEKHNVAVIPAAAFYTDDSGRNVVRLNFSMSEKDLIEEGVKRMSMLLKEMTGSSQAT
ncbi:PLP-dependent aminotransferase family protein [Desulfurococcus mucosus]|uniref:Putative transcriptional regulator, GntR family n=1 Tax=Desulfurococcus mucosus (strain ATCC 35584 / DSM 2162 / JCM 9187 / O7/1) TaxID=765177 RepID=E8R869_DESM0|nr:PLP-dependent aminotransferase family protein [Desulfurococcus mucosus]ADV64695.1 putative transcriptional regulator, GntR family [Desulfurococcus mucosus DSM 2162]